MVLCAERCDKGAQYVIVPLLQWERFEAESAAADRFIASVVVESRRAARAIIDFMPSALENEQEFYIAIRNSYSIAHG